MSLEALQAHWLCWSVGCLLAALWLWRVIDTAWGMSKLTNMGRPQWDRKSPQPRVSIIVPALNEEQTIEPALESLLNLDYQDYEIVAVDDRSTDSTGAIIERAAAASGGKLRVVHIQQLPAGWLGKPHAMWRGAQQATGDWLVFTDADVVYRPEALRRAVAYAETTHPTDHLALIPDMEMSSPGERMMLALFCMYFILEFRPWKAADPASSEYVGGGVFNMIRRPVYQRIGTFQALRMEVVEDMKLGKLVKQHGFTQRCALAPALLRIRWVVGAFGFVRNVTKNFFALSGFRPWRALLTMTKMMFFMLLPYAGAVLAPGWSKAGFLLTLAIIFSLYAGMSLFGSISPFYVFTHPVGTVLLLYAMLRSLCVTLWNRGIDWRGTKYPLEELRKGLV